MSYLAWLVITAEIGIVGNVLAIKYNGLKSLLIIIGLMIGSILGMAYLM